MIAVTEDNYESVVLGANIPVLLDIYADWCPPCRRIAPLIEQLAVELEGRAFVAKLDSEAYPNLIARLGINSLPTFLVFNEGSEVHRMVGLQARETLLDRLGLTNLGG
jgi:thioredoxin 1